MESKRRRILAATAALLTLAGPAVAQNDPHLGYAYPAGGQQGTVFEVTIGGQHLDGVTGIHVSGTGLRGAVIEHQKPLSRKEMGELRSQLRKLQQRMRKGQKPDPEAPAIEYQGRDLASMTKEELDALNQKLFDPKKQPNAQIAETVLLHVSIASDAEPGDRELRLITPAGLSNPLRFHVGSWPEYVESEPNDGRPDATIRAELPAVVNGQILPGDVDRFRIRARAGQSLVVSARARELIPYLADAVPGWFQATLALFDAGGEEVAFVDDFRFHPDPVLHCIVPADGEYVLEIRDSIYRGREDFVYRITVGEVPYVTNVFPLGARAAEAAAVKMHGWNLLEDELLLGDEDVRPGVHALTWRGENAATNHVPFAVDTLPECLEVEPNDRPEEAQWPSLPKIVNGRIDPPGDRDVFLITGEAGDVVVAEVTARRLHSPLDSVLWVTEAGTGRELARNDDHEDRGAGLTTHQADSRLTFTLPVDGNYFLHLADAQHKGGEAYAYRLRVSPLLPDFELRVVPSAINVRAGTTVPFTVHALRKDGFEGGIALKLKDAPPGFVLHGGWVPGGCDEMRLTLTAPATPPKEPVRLVIEGRAKIEGREVKRVAVPAEDMMQAFLNRHLVPASDLFVAVTARGRGLPPLQLIDTKPVRLPVGGTAEVRLRGPRKAPSGKIVFELSEAPEGITIQRSSPLRPETTLVLHADADLVTPGWKGNLIVDVYLERAVMGKDGKNTGRKRRVPLGTLPAIRLTTVKP